MSAPVFKSLVYLSPWYPLPPGWNQVGVEAVVDDPDPSASSLILAGRLRQGGTTLQVGLGMSATDILLVPTSPLSAMLDYYLDVQWVSADTTDADSVSWDDSDAIATAPVLSAMVTLQDGAIDGSTASLAWDFGAAALTAAGANITTFNTSGKSAGFSRVQGLSGTLTLNSKATTGTQMYLQGVIPIYGSPDAGFAEPFSMGPILSGVPLPVDGPTITSVDYDGGTLAVGWTVPTAPTTGGAAGYELVVSNGSGGGATVAAANAGGGVTVLASPPAAGWTVAGRIRYGVIQGAPGTAATPLQTAPTGLAVSTDASTGVATLSWTDVPDATGYTVHFSDGRTPVSVGSASCTLEAAATAGNDLRLWVTAMGIASEGAALTGPRSDALRLPTTAPALVSADYDGARVSASWQAVAAAAGYVVSVLDGTGAVAASSAQTADTAIRFDQTFDAAAGPFTVVVQAVTEAGTGLPSAPLPLLRPSLFLSAEPPDTAPPNIFPSDSLSPGPTQITIYLPPLGESTITVDAVGPFALESNADSTALPYRLVFAEDSSVWDFTVSGESGSDPAPSIRPELQADYVAFLQAVEAAGASSWGIAVLQQAISRWMPQTFAETHYYAYGLDLPSEAGSTGSIDLRQGLTLRVGFANYTNVWSGDAQSWLNGFGGGPPSDFDVADGVSGTGDWQLTLDAFVAQLTASGVMTVAPPETVTAAETAAGVADAADLFFPGFPNPFYRLFFPSQLQNPTSTGSTATLENFTLASASGWASLCSATATPETGAPVVYFRGRSVLRPMIRIRVNDVELVAPLGTTVGNILDRYGVRPPSTAIQLTGVTLERAAGPGPAVLGSDPQTPTSYDCAQRRQVRLNWGTMATYDGPEDATSLPLLHGDRIVF